jgi:hypothetical protein
MNDMSDELMNSLVEKLLEVFTAIQKSLDQYSKYF